jgi:BirA family biotin operon repressor/biotin-[acetyl-CoA-carboxylase] ligase
MNTRLAILRVLSDGALHSGADIGAKLDISRAAVCKAVNAIAESGLAIDAVSGRGYRLQAPLVLLDRKRIASHVTDEAIASRQIEILEQVDSTNRHLLSQIQAHTDSSDVNGRTCLAEVQPRGRGRRGRGWVTTPYSNLMLSMSWRFAGGAAMLAGLSLAAGVAVQRALERCGAKGVGLKWPNDVLCGEKKLAGLLIDVSGEATGPCTVVLGVGINCYIAPAEGALIDQPWTDLQTITGATVDRNRLAALLIEQLHKMFREFALTGLSGFRAQWERHHLYAARAVRVIQGDDKFDGVVEGVDENGALRVRDARGQSRAFHSGDVSLRTAR